MNAVVGRVEDQVETASHADVESLMEADYKAHFLLALRVPVMAGVDTACSAYLQAEAGLQAAPAMVGKLWGHYGP